MVAEDVVAWSGGLGEAGVVLLQPRDLFVWGGCFVDEVTEFDNQVCAGLVE